jgi:hypothetical protein
MEYEEPEDEEVQMHMTYVPDDDAGYPDEDEGPINMVSPSLPLKRDTLLMGRTPTLMENCQQRSERRIRRVKTRLSSQRWKKWRRRI